MVSSTLVQSLFIAGSLLPVALGAAVKHSDPCVKIAGQTFVPPADALACMKSFPFNETLRDNVLAVVERVFDFYTFEDYYLNSPPPFQESTTNIRADLQRIAKTHYATDFDFNFDLYNVVNTLNDGHTQWEPSCYWLAFQNLLPAPVVSLEINGQQNLYVAPDSVEFVSQLGTNYTNYFKKIGFNWQRLAGAKILEIEGKSAYDYVDFIASTQTGTYLDHGVRVNSVFSSYRLVSGVYSQRFGDLAGPVFPNQNTLTMKVILANATKAETVQVPYLADYLGGPFTDGPSYWAANCAANDATNGVDIKATTGRSQSGVRRPFAKASIIDASAKKSVNLPPEFTPTLPQLNASAGEIRSYILSDKKTGAMFVGSFEPADFVQFQEDVVSAFQHFEKNKVSRLIIDLTDNGGGFVCLGFFLHQYLAGSKFGGGYGGFVSSMRGNTLAQKIVDNDIKLNLSVAEGLFYPSDNWAFISNNTEAPNTWNYETPNVPITISGVHDHTSQRFYDVCTPYNVPLPKEPLISLNNVAIVGNGNCASTCAMFSTLMFERHHTKMAVFGGKPGEQLQYKGMAGNQVLEWVDLDTEIKSADLKDDPLAPPDLLVNANMRHNWRTAWSWLNENVPIAYESEPAQFRFAYTPETYNNPQNLWEFAAKQLFH